MEFKYIEDCFYKTYRKTAIFSKLYVHLYILKWEKLIASVMYYKTWKPASQIVIVWHWKIYVNVNVNVSEFLVLLNFKKLLIAEF